MNRTIYEKREFELITRDGKLTWIEKGKDKMTTMHERILVEKQSYEQLGSPLPDFAQACWIPFVKSYTDFGYALVDTKTSKIIAKLTYRHGFFEGNVLHPESRYIGEFAESHKAMLCIEEEMYGDLLAEFDIYFVEEWTVPV